MNNELFKAKWKYSEDPEKKKGKRAHQAASVAVVGASGYGGYKMGAPVGANYSRNRFVDPTVGRKAALTDAVKTAAKTKGFRQGAALGVGAVAAGGIADHVARKKDVIVRKSADHSDSPFLTEEISKINAAAHRSIWSHQALWSEGAKKTGKLASNRSGLPLNARKASARLDRKKGTTKTPFGRPS